MEIILGLDRRVGRNCRDCHGIWVLIANLGKMLFENQTLDTGCSTGSRHELPSVSPAIAEYLARLSTLRSSLASALYV